MHLVGSKRTPPSTTLLATSDLSPDSPVGPRDSTLEYLKEEEERHKCKRTYKEQGKNKGFALDFNSQMEGESRRCI